MNTHSFLVMTAILTLGLISSCSTDEKSQKLQWADTNKTYLSSESINFLLPNVFKRSSRYRLKEDVPLLARDTSRLVLIQNRLESMEFKDSEIDVFVDTTSMFRMLVISNMEKIPFSKDQASFLDAQIQATNRRMELANPSIKFQKIESKTGGSPDLFMAKYKNKMVNYFEGTEVYNSLFYLTTSANSIVVIEFNNDEDDLEKTMWTFRDK